MTWRTASALLVMVLLSWQPVAAAQDLAGVWRGELEYQPNFKLTLGLVADDGELAFTSPNQGPKQYAITDWVKNGDQVSFKVPDIGASFAGTLDEQSLQGTFTQGQDLPLTFHQLDADDLERLTYEGQYAGQLKAGANELPLLVNVAVVKGGFLGTVDSPAQQSFGIPLQDLEISAQQLRFTSALLNANYQGEANEDGDYVGVWAQGVPLPLTLSKVTEDKPAPKVEQPNFGEKGGALAVVSNTDKQLEYRGEHNAKTHYEIGSVTKTFIAYLLADAVLNDVVTLDTPLATYFPDAPETITLEQLATHTSGLPRLPEDLFTGANRLDPYAHYDLSALRKALAEQELSGNAHSYSNYAFGALAEALAKAHDTSLPDLLQEKIFAPFGMSATYVATPEREEDEYFAMPHDSIGSVVQPWHFQALAGAGAIVSTLPDMVAYVEGMQQRLQEDPKLRELLVAPRLEFATCCQQALGWMLEQDDEGRTYVWHNGQTAGFASYVGFYPDGEKAVILLNNQAININSEAKRLLTATSTEENSGN